jgi:hypothetical protein
MGLLSLDDRLADVQCKHADDLIVCPFPVNRILKETKWIAADKLKRSA